MKNSTEIDNKDNNIVYYDTDKKQFYFLNNKLNDEPHFPKYRQYIPLDEIPLNDKIELARFFNEPPYSNVTELLNNFSKEIKSYINFYPHNLTKDEINDFIEIRNNIKKLNRKITLRKNI